MTKTFTRRQVVVALSLLILAAASLVAVSTLTHDNTRVKTYRTADGWGYSITQKGKVIIHQPFIPAVEGKIPFTTKRDAAKTGKMVIKKMKQNKLPSLTEEELRKAGITIKGSH